MILQYRRYFVLLLLWSVAAQVTTPQTALGQVTTQKAAPSSPPSLLKINLTAEATGGTTVTLFWNAVATASRPDVYRYYVYRGAASGGPYVLAVKDVTTRGTRPGKTGLFQWSDPAGLTPTGSHFYLVRAMQSGGEAAQSNEVGDHVQFALGLGTGMEGGYKIKLYWNAVTAASRYHVYRSTASGGPYSLVASVTKPAPGPSTEESFVYVCLIGVGAKIRYFYVVRAVQSGRETVQSNEVGSYEPEIDVAKEAARRSHLPFPKMHLVVAATGDRKITLFWTKMPGASSYNVYRSRHEGGPYRRIASRVKTPDRNPGVTDMFLFSDFNLARGVSFFYAVKAVQRGREIAYSNAEDGIVEENAIPWDTGDAARILRMEREGINKVLDPDTDPKTGKKVPVDVGLLSITGPDGAIYESPLDSEHSSEN